MTHYAFPSRGRSPRRRRAPPTSSRAATSGWAVVRGHPFDEQDRHGFIASQRQGIEVFRTIPPDAPLLMVEAVWQYSHHVLAGLRTHRATDTGLAIECSGGSMEIRELTVSGVSGDDVPGYEATVPMRASRCDTGTRLEFPGGLSLTAGQTLSLVARPW